MHACVRYETEKIKCHEQKWKWSATPARVRAIFHQIFQGTRGQWKYERMVPEEKISSRKKNSSRRSISLFCVDCISSWPSFCSFSNLEFLIIVSVSLKLHNSVLLYCVFAEEIEVRAERIVIWWKVQLDVTEMMIELIHRRCELWQTKSCLLNLFSLSLSPRLCVQMAMQIFMDTLSQFFS